jgi:uncharacterized protein (DUF488 family)
MLRSIFSSGNAEIGFKEMSSILTIGHSTRAIEEFVAMLKAHGIEMLIDIRTVPRSRRHPQFNKESLPETLARERIGYEHMAGLGGLRKPRKGSVNRGWRNDSFRGYADYMQTPEFERSVDELVSAARNKRVAVMCAEAVPWRCHRSLLADALSVRGLRVAHIMSQTTANEHRLTPWALVEGTRITYPPDTPTLNFNSEDQP